LSPDPKPVLQARCLLHLVTGKMPVLLIVTGKMPVAPCHRQDACATNKN